MANKLKVKIAGHSYTIVLMPEDWTTDTVSHGSCDPTKQIIKIARGLPKDRAIETLLHEIGHAIYYEYGLTHVTGEEPINSLYMSGVFQVLRDNPHVVKALG